MRNFILFQPAKLPRGFRYPAELLAVASGRTYVDLYPWIFVDAASELGALTLLVGKGEHNLIPFAAVSDDCNSVACFDGGDKSGDPTVHFLQSRAERVRYAFECFAAWRRAADKDAAQWRAARLTG